MISAPKSILYNEIPDSARQPETPCFGPGQAELSTSLPLSPLNVLRLTAGILFLIRPETYILQTRTGGAMPRFGPERRTAQKEIGLIPKLNRMPDGSRSVKAGTSNLQPGTAGGERVACPNPGADGTHGGQVIVQVVHGV